MKNLKLILIYISVFILSTIVVFGETINEGTKDTKSLLSQKDLKWLKEHPNPKIGVWTNVPPYAFPDSNGDPQGIFPDYIKEIEKILNITFTIVPVSSFAIAWEKAMNKELDLLVAVTRSEEHLNYMNLSDTYHVVPIVLVSRTDMPFVSSIREFSGKKVVVGKGHVTGQWIKKDYPEIKLIPIEDYEQGLRLVSEGKADAYAAAMGALTWQIKKNRITNLKIATKSPYEYKLSIAVRKDWPNLITIINSALPLIEKSKQDSIYDRWAAVRFETGIDWILIWKISLAIIIFATTIFVVIFIWNRKLANEIIERKKVEEALKRSEKLLNETGRVAKVGGWELDANTMEVSWTEEIYNIHEIPTDQKPGLENAIDFYHPDDRDKIESAVKKALDHGCPYDLEVRFITAKGNHLWIRTICYPIIKNGKTIKLTGAFQDITQQKIAEEKIWMANREWANTFNTVPDQICILDTEYRIVRMNKAMAEKLDVNAGEVEGQTCYECIHRENSPPSDCPHHQLLTDGKEHTIEIFEEYLGGDMLLTVTPILNSTGSLVGSVHVARDITDIKNTQRENEKLIGELKEALERIKTLRGLIPICASCKKIRDDQGYWNNLEAFIEKHSDASFSHGICEQCSDKLYGKEDWYIEMKKKKENE